MHYVSLLFIQTTQQHSSFLDNCHQGAYLNKPEPRLVLGTDLQQPELVA